MAKYKTSKGDKVRYNLYTYIRLFNRKYGFSPSYYEMCIDLGIRSTSTIKYHLDILEKQGMITRIVVRGKHIPRGTKTLNK